MQPDPTPDLSATVDELIELIDYLAPPDDERPLRRGRRSFESPLVWDGGQQWERTDKRIADAVWRARKAQEAQDDA